MTQSPPFVSAATGAAERMVTEHEFTCPATHHNPYQVTTRK